MPFIDCFASYGNPRRSIAAMPGRPAVMSSSAKPAKGAKRNKAVREGKKREVSPPEEEEELQNGLEAWPSIRLSEAQGTSSHLPALISKDGR